MRGNTMLVEHDAAAREITLVSEDAFAEWRATLDTDAQQRVEDAGFAGRPHQIVENLENAGVAIGWRPGAGRWVLGSAPTRLRVGLYRLADDCPTDLAERAVVSWMLGAYRFDTYKTSSPPVRPRLCWPASVDRQRVVAEVEAIRLVRDLVNTPANDMGPMELQGAAEDLASRHGAEIRTIIGQDLLSARFPLVHTVGRASSRAPRMIELNWGDPAAPRLTLVGKGVCFDTGGLGLKPAEAMFLMKKDMGGAAHALGLAHLIMALNLPLRLRVLIPAVENAIGGAAMRPLDVITSRKGLTVEIGHTDAEGRLILADALAAADEGDPELILDFATLTSAARFALGPDIPALFTQDEDLARTLLDQSRSQEDPLWRLPFWSPYGEEMEGRAGDVVSVMPTNLGGAIYAAEFLKRFVRPTTAWAHIDLFAWNQRDRPGRPAGGEAQTLLTALAAIVDRFAISPNRSMSK